MIQKYILSLTEPFCISDLFRLLKKRGIINRDLILDSLDNLYDIGLIDYRCVNHQNSEWAFVVI